MTAEYTPITQDQIRSNCEDGRRNGGLLLDLIGNDPTIIQGLEERVAMLLIDSSEAQHSYFQGMWHVVSQTPLNVYTQRAKAGGEA